jgi:transposase
MRARPSDDVLRLMYEREEKSVAEIARLHKVGEATAYRWLVAVGVTFRDAKPRSDHVGGGRGKKGRGQPNYLSDEDARRVHERRAAKPTPSIRALAKEFGVTRQAISQILSGKTHPAVVSVLQPSKRVRKAFILGEGET